MNRKSCFITLAMLMAFMFPTTSDAYIGLCCGKCGGNMPMNIPGGGIPETHEFRFKISPVLMHMGGLRQGTHHVAAATLLGMPTMMGVATGKYMAVPSSMDMKMLNFTAGYSFSDDFFAAIMGMYGDNRMAMDFSKMMRRSTGVGGFTMQSQGLMDTMLMAKYRIFSDDPLIPAEELSLFAALSIPTGSIDKRNSNHPLAMRRGELLPYGMQLGSGTWDPTVGLLYQRSMSPWWWGINGRYTQRVGYNKRGYRLGDRAQLDAYLMYQADVSWLLYGELQGDWQGRMHGQANEARSGASGHAIQGDPNSPYATPLWNPAYTGKSQIFTTIGLQWQPVPLHIVDIGVQLPLYQRMNGLQLQDRWRVMLTWYMEIPTAKSVRALPASDREEDAKLGF